ncbi:LysR family transcriptional regulator [Variovorax robiniae]|uniref:LysR family transcriptional regulator n=1 Tax=Variovorax robiniae TaxID=1836199 RepID=A0ABU8X6B0_9BURK
MLELGDLRLMRALQNTGSLAGAARSLDLTPPALTVRLRKLEDSVGVHLATRSARGIALTEEGERLCAEAAELLERLEQLSERIATGSKAMSGHLKIAAPFGFGRQHLARVVARLHRDHPDISVTLALFENPMRHAAAFDVVVHIGEVKDSSWVGHPIAPNGRLLCASPRFLKRLAQPLVHPGELQDLPCLCLKENDDDLIRWKFSNEAQGAGKSVTVRVAGALSSNDGSVITDWAVGGLGVMVRSEWEAAPLIARGELVELLPHWKLQDAPVIALVPTRKGVSARLRLFLETAREALDPAPWRPGSGISSSATAAVRARTHGPSASGRAPRAGGR